MRFSVCLGRIFLVAVRTKSSTHNVFVQQRQCHLSNVQYCLSVAEGFHHHRLPLQPQRGEVNQVWIQGSVKKICLHIEGKRGSTFRQIFSLIRICTHRGTRGNLKTPSHTLDQRSSRPDENRALGFYALDTI